MKRNIFKALAALTALVFASCTMGNTIEKQNDNTDGKTAYITIGLNEIARIISGAKITSESLASAKTLLQNQ